MKLMWITDKEGKLTGIFNTDAIDYLDEKDGDVRMAMRNGHFNIFTGQTLEYFLDQLKKAL